MPETDSRPLKIAVASDLHVGPKNRGADLRPEPLSEDAVDTAYLERFLAFVADAGLSADYLFLPGDVSESAKLPEFEMASALIKRIAEALKVRLERILFVPGNHDVNWAVIRAYESSTGPFIVGQKFAALRHPDWIFGPAMARGEPPELCAKPYLGVWEYPDLMVVGLNSSSEDTPDNYPHHGHISNDTLVALAELLKHHQWRSTQARMLLLHHHPVSYQDPIEGEPDFSQMTGAPALLALLQDHRFDVIVHGHRHSPRLVVHDDDRVHPIPILCAGSFAATITARWAGVVFNQFHMLEIEGRRATSHLSGVAKSWSYSTAKGWTPSQTAGDIGVPAIAGFGEYPTLADMTTHVGSLLAGILQSRTYVTWRELMATDDRIRYAPYRLSTVVTKRLAQTGAFVLVGEPPDATLVRS